MFFDIDLFEGNALTAELSFQTRAVATPGRAVHDHGYTVADRLDLDPTDQDFRSLAPISFHIYYSSQMAEKKVTGPASYFPSIEKKYGKPIQYWMKALNKVSNLTHMEQVAYLKENFEMGHGHANAIVHVFRAENGMK